LHAKATKLRYGHGMAGVWRERAAMSGAYAGAWLVGQRGVRGRVARAGWKRKAVAWRFPSARTSGPRVGFGVRNQRTKVRWRRHRRGARALWIAWVLPDSA
jgi:hypothetical protein